jgi:hypothetical protein
MLVEYTGHRGLGGLQGHSIGSSYPYIVFKKENESGKYWCVLDARTSEVISERETQDEANNDINELKGWHHAQITSR